MSDVQHKTCDFGVKRSGVALYFGGDASQLKMFKVGPTAAMSDMQHKTRN